MILLNNKDFRFIKVKKRDKKAVEDSWTTKNNYEFYSNKIQDWIKNGGNVGVLTGVGNLLVIDFDDLEFQKKYIGLLPSTLMQRSGTGKMHLFYIADNPESLKILDNNKKTMADIQGIGRQIIVYPSIHPNGKQYVFVNDLPIAHIKIAEVKALFHEYLNIKDKKTQLVVSQSDFVEKPELVSILAKYGVDISKNPTQCLWHDSMGGKCFSFSKEKQLFHCFHCNKSGDVISFIMEHKNIDFVTACKELNIPIKEISEKLDTKTGKTIIVLTNKLRNDLNEISLKIGKHIVKDKTIFYRPYLNQLVEVSIIQSREEIENNRSRVRISNLDEFRIRNKINDHIDFVEIVTKKKELLESPTTLTKQELLTIMKNDNFLGCLPILDKVMSRPYFYEKEKNVYVEYEGHSIYTNIFFTPDTPNVSPQPIEESKKEIKKLLSGFCFESEEDREMAIAFLLTPALRGLYPDSRERTPCFALIANRERAGKDYLAGVRTILYTGVQIDNPPISDGERPNVDEWRKKFTTMLMTGDTIFHSANNVGYLNNSVFEALITTKVMQDRLLGSNTQRNLDNCLDFSFSANMGLRWRGDMSGRLRRINLFYSEEDPNSREYEIPDLHGYITKNRGYILSCIYSLIKEWYVAGKPCQDGKVFTSFPVWARYCGGIMDFHKLGNPLRFQEDDELSGNEEERIMTAVYEFIYFYQGEHDQVTIKTPEIIEAISHYQQLSTKEKIDIYHYADINDEAIMEIDVSSTINRRVFGKVITKYKGRVLKGIRFKVVQDNKESKRRIYRFEKVLME